MTGKKAGNKKPTKKETDQLSKSVIKGIKEKKGHDIVSLDLRKLGNTVADIFIVCHGDSRVQVDAISDSIEEQVYKDLKETPLSKEGKSNAEWVILDFSNVVVHVFRKDKREFYGIENLWGDAEIKHVAANR